MAATGNEAWTRRAARHLATHACNPVTRFPHAACRYYSRHGARGQPPATHGGSGSGKVGSPFPLQGSRMTRIAFIGGGNMARSLIGGLLATGLAPADICVAEPLAEARERRPRFRRGLLRGKPAGRGRRRGDRAGGEAAGDARVHAELRLALQGRRPLLISIAAGVRLDQLERWLGPLPIVRCMPNTLALIGAPAPPACAPTAGSAPRRRRRRNTSWPPPGSPAGSTTRR